MESNINIYLNNLEDTGTESNPIRPGATPDLDNPTKQKEQSGKGSSISAAAVGSYIAKQSIQNAAQRVGQVVGSSKIQEQINAISSLAMYGTAIAVNPVFGTAMLAINTGFELFDYYKGQEDEKRTLSVIQKRAGADLNRSR